LPIIDAYYDKYNVIFAYDLSLIPAFLLTTQSCNGAAFFMYEFPSDSFFHNLLDLWSKYHKIKTNLHAIKDGVFI